MAENPLSGHQRALAAAYTALAQARPEQPWQSRLSPRYVDAWDDTMNGPRGRNPDRRDRTDCAVYYQWLHDSFSGYQDNNWLVEYAPWFEQQQFASLTEVGCGNGRFLRAIAPKVSSVVGHDWALSAKLADLPSNVAVSPCNLLLDPVTPAELVCSADVLEHIAPDSIERVVAKLHHAGRHNFHAMACYDDGHSHLTIMPPDAWLKLFRNVSDQYRLIAVDARRNNPDTLVCIVANLAD